MNSQPLVSVVMATFNETPHIIEASINSILEQSYGNFEFIIVDDSTKAETRQAIDKLATDQRIKVYHNEHRLGLVPSLNLGLKKANGKYIARMDGDDISFPDRFEKEVAFLEKNRNIYVVGGQINIIDENGTITSTRKYPIGGMKLYLYSAIRNPLANPTVMMRREVIDAGIYYNESLTMSEDLDMWLRVMNHSYKIANLPDTVLDYRVTNNFLDKRCSRKQVEYMANVRKNNFNKKHLLHSCLSFMAGWIFKTMPVAAIKSAYNSENKRG